MTACDPDWLECELGTRPTQRWGFATSAPLVELQVARETGEVVAADADGTLYLLNRHGELTQHLPIKCPIKRLTAADIGGAFAAILHDDSLLWLDDRLQVVWNRVMSEDVLSLSMTPHGTHVLVALTSGQNLLYDRDKRKVSTFESLRPLRWVSWLLTTPGFVAAADYGLLARYAWPGQQEWNERLWSSVGDMAATGDGASIVLAGLSLGLQVFDGTGAALGSFVMEGTAHRVALTYQPYRIAAASLEHRLLLLDAQGGVKWQLQTPADVVKLHLAPLGDWLIVGLADGRVVRLDLD